MENKVFYCFFPFLVCQLLSCSIVTHAQTANNDCLTSRLVCGNSSLADNSNGFSLNDFIVNDRGCLREGEHQSAWYTFRIHSAGTLAFTIIPKQLTNDYDFAVWGPNVTCNALGTPIRCNFSGTDGITGLSFTALTTSEDEGGSVYVKYLDVLAGETYYLLVDNYSNNNEGFDLDWGGTAMLSIVNANFNASVACNRAKFANASATCEAATSLSYVWDFGDGSAVTAENTIGNPLHIYTTVGTYTATLVVTANNNGANNGETATYSMPITILSTPPAVAIQNISPTYCYDGSIVKLTATPSGGKFSIGGVTLVNDLFNPALFNVGENIEIKYTYTNEHGCTSTTQKTTTIIPSKFIDNISEEFKICPDRRGFTLEAFTEEEEREILATQNAILYEWSNGATSRTILIKNESDIGQYTITVRNSAGCPLYKISHDVAFNCAVPYFTVPTSFTPNGDGRNDVWEIFGDNFTALDLRVYNRWGELVYIARYKEDTWDGKVNGKPAPEGVYAWQASYENPLKQGIKIRAQGSVHIIR